MASGGGIESVTAEQALLRLQDSIRARKGILVCGDEYAAAVTAEGGVLYAGTNSFGQEDSSAWQNVRGIFGSRTYLAGLMADGTVSFVGQDFDGARAGVAYWGGVRLLACSSTHIAALQLGGRVLCAGGTDMPFSQTSDWTDIRDICCGQNFTLGLKADGSVLIAGGTYALRERIASWGRVAGLFADARGSEAYAITAEGRLVATCRLSRRVRSWKNLIFVASSGHCLWALTAQGVLLTEYRGANRFPVNTSYVTLSAGVSNFLTLDKVGGVGLSRACGRHSGSRFDETEMDIDTGMQEFSQWPCLFEQFESFAVARREAEGVAVREERAFLLRATQARRYDRRLSCGERMTACITALGQVLTTGGLEQVRTWSGITSLSCGASHLLALRWDGRVLADGNDTGGSCQTGNWDQALYVQACRDHSLALRADGRVLYAGIPDAPYGQVSDWNHVSLLRATDTLTVGVTTDGRLLTCGVHPALASFRRMAEDSPVSDSDEPLGNWLDLRDMVVSDHIIAGLYRDGRVFAVSDGASGELERAVGSWRGIRMLAVGDRHLVGLCDSGRVVAAGEDGFRQCDVLNWRRIVWLSCGSACTVGLCADGTVVAAGRMSVGMQGGSERVWIPCNVSDWAHVLTVRCGANHVVALTESGQLLTCGQDTEGQCREASYFAVFRDIRQYDGYTVFGNTSQGNGASFVVHETDTDGSVPDERGIFPDDEEWASYAPFLRGDAEQLSARIRVNEHEVILLTPEGTFRWQYDTRKLIRDDTCVIRREVWHGMGGFAADVSASVPGADIVAMSSSGEHTVLLRADGTVTAVGCNTSAECRTEGWKHILQVVALPGVTLGLRSDGRVLFTGKRGRILAGLYGVRAVAGSGDRAVFVLSDGSLRVHLRGSEFQPERVEGVRLFCSSGNDSLLLRFYPHMKQGENARMVHRLLGCGISHVVRLTSNGTVFAVGNNDYGQCCVSEWKNVTAVSCGLAHTAAVADGRILAVGANRDGQCDAERLNEALENVSDGRTDTFTFQSVACGYAHTVALRSDGCVFAVGASPDGRCDTTSWQNVVDISCGVRHTAAVLFDGHCVACGDNRSGQCAVGGWTNITMVACGEFHTIGLTSDGRVLAAGSSGAEYCRVDDLRDVISIACLPEATVCVHADGHLTVRGSDSVLAEATASIRDAVAVDGKEYRLAVLTVDRRILIFPDIRHGSDDRQMLE